MMLRNLLDEVMRRRLWPVIAIAALVAVAAPLLFLKSSPSSAPVAAPAPGSAPEGELPARAERLLAATGQTATGVARKPSGRAGDPFQPPSSQAAAAGASTAAQDKPKAAAAAAGAPTEPVPVVVTNADGSKATTPAATPGTTSIPASPITSGAPVKTVVKRGRSVDVRFGKSAGTRVRRRIPRQQTFVAGGRVIAIFVKYSPKRRKAVFAIAPTTLVTGGIECRRKQDVCRYVDIPAGRHVRLTTLAANGSVVSRRLDVVRIGRSRRSPATAAAAGARVNGSCLLGKLLRLGAKDAPLAGDACS